MERHWRLQRLQGGQEQECENILRALPDWFGIEEFIREYRGYVENDETWVVQTQGQVIGFAAFKQHFPRAGELRVMAVQREWQGQGVGAALVRHGEIRLRDSGVRYLQVKTLGPTANDPFYERTRHFYEKTGFVALEETYRIWGPGSPCLLMIKDIGS